MDRVVCNIPHSGTEIPEWSLADFLVERSVLDAFTQKLADLDVDKLFSFVPAGQKVISPVSRAGVDMERFRNDEDERMAQLGMGLFYEKDDLGRPIRKRGETYGRCLALYDAYHAELTARVAACLDANGVCRILDCHSFHDDLQYTGHAPETFPDICIGFNEERPSADVLWIRDLFLQNGYSVAFNLPFAGSLVPLDFLHDTRMSSIMLELNRRVYLHNEDAFLKIQELCREIVCHLNRP